MPGGEQAPVLLADNPGGLWLNVGHPYIAPLWNRFRYGKGLTADSYGAVLDRKEFEEAVLSRGILLTDNPYGFLIHTGHPEILQLWHRFKRWKQIPANMPADDEQRREFERYIFRHELLSLFLKEEEK